MWTVEKVKEILPTVRVYNSQTREEREGSVCGRRCGFAIVWVGNVCWEFGWQQIANALNNGNPLIA